MASQMEVGAVQLVKQSEELLYTTYNSGSAKLGWQGIKLHEGIVRFSLSSHMFQLDIPGAYKVSPYPHIYQVGVVKVEYLS